MSKKVIHFSKGFVPCVILSVLLILSGIFALITKGLNLGIAFKAGLIEDIRIAPTALELTYSGPANVSVQITGIGMTVVVSGVGAENASYEIPYVRYRTVGEVASALNEITGVNAVVRSAPNLQVCWERLLSDCTISDQRPAITVPKTCAMRFLR